MTTISRGGSWEVDQLELGFAPAMFLWAENSLMAGLRCAYVRSLLAAEGQPVWR